MFKKEARDDMIPKRIHYCWFGGGKMPKMLRECIATWHQHMPDWEYVLWDEKACENLPDDIENPLLHPFVQSAYKAKKWAFVADYVRFWALYHFGGVYLDTDMYVVKPLDDLLDNKFFSAWENKDNKYVSCGCVGALKDNVICLSITKAYQDKIYDKSILSELVIPHIITPIVLKNNGATIYSHDFFYPYSYEDKWLRTKKFLDSTTPNTYAIHLWDLSWSNWYKKLWAKIYYTLNNHRTINTQNIIHFVDYCPKIYSGMDRWLLLLGKKLMVHELRPICVYVGDFNEVPKLAQDYNKAGITVEFLPNKSKFTQILSTIHILIKYRPKMVHAHFMNHIKWWLAILRPIFGYTYYVNWHGIIYDGGWTQYRQDNNILKAWTYRNVFCGIINRSAQKVFCVSKAVGKLWNSFQSCDKTQILYLGIEHEQHPLERHIIREQLNIPQNEITLVNISAIEEIKGIDLIIKALALLKKDGCSCHFYHIGGLRANGVRQVSYYNELQQLAKELHVEEMITWMGKRTDVQQILPAFDIYIHPSREEGLPVAIMEAAAACLPIIGSNIGGIPEIVRHEKNGYLITKEDYNRLAELIKTLIEDEMLRIEFGAESRRIVISDYDINKQTDKLINAYIGC